MNANNNQRPRNPALHTNHRKRMKDKFLKLGLDAFSEHEIMEMLLYYALPQVDTNEIAHELINKGGSFVGVFDLPYEEMKKVTGIKDQAATFLKFIPAIVRYYCVQEAEEASSPNKTYEDIAQICVNSFIGVRKETLLCFSFDSKMRLIDKRVLGEGGYNNVLTSFREIAENILKLGGTNLVLAHNHPLTCKPSHDDIDSTKYIEKLLAPFEIKLIEHFVVSGPSYWGILMNEEHNNSTYLRKYNL